ncbi:MAG: hypothetical protein RL213_1619 [Bacteroidota bacterium]|jgi:glycosyltransferase involved in cell wall biosynthesis
MASSTRRIALIGPAHPLRGGIADFNEALARSLQQHGIDVEVFSFHLQYPALLFPGKSQFTDAPAPEGIRIRPTLSSIGPLSWLRTAREVIASRPDLVVIRYWLPFMAPALGTVARKIRKAGIPVVAITDNVLPHEKRPGDRQLTGYFVRSCDGFVAMSRSVLNDLSQFTATPNKIFLPHPVYDIFGDPIDKNEARRILGIPAEEKWLLFFGFVRRYKGLDLLLEAMSDPGLREKKVRLLVAGEFYEDRKPYDEAVERYGLKDAVRFDSGFIPKEKIREYFCAADMVVQPYRTATQSGITQIAYHFGRPMLVTDVGGLSEIVDHDSNGYVVSPEPSGIASAINDFYSRNREHSMALRVAEARSRFSWDTFVRSLLDFHETVRKSRP